MDAQCGGADQVNQFGRTTQCSTNPKVRQAGETFLQTSSDERRLMSENSEPTGDWSEQSQQLETVTTVALSRLLVRRTH